MATIKFYDITKKEEENILSLFRIPITFFGTDEDEKDVDNEDIDENDTEDDEDDDDVNGDSNDEDDNDSDNDEDNDEPDEESDKDGDNDEQKKDSGKENNNADGNGKDSDKDDNSDKHDKDSDKINDSGSKNSAKGNGNNVKNSEQNIPNQNETVKNGAQQNINKEPNAVDNARKMKPKDSSPKSSPNNKMPESDKVKNIPGADKALKAKQGLDAIKNAKDDPTGAIEKGGTEAAKLGAKAIGNAVAPGVGEAAAKAIDVADKLLEKTELGRKAKKTCCTGCLVSSCLSFLCALSITFLPILLALMATSFIFDIFQLDQDPEKEDPEKNFVHILEDGTKDTLNNPKESLKKVLEKALKDVGYYKQKEADEKGEEFEDENGSSVIFYSLLDNYSESRLKYPASHSKPEDFPEGQEDFEEYYIPNNLSPYFAMENKHMPLFQDVLNNLLEKDYNKLSSDEKLKANVLKNLFNYDSKIVEFIDEITEALDKKYSNVYNPVTKLSEDSLSLRDLFEELSTNVGDAKYDLNTVTKILGYASDDYPSNAKIRKAYYDLQENLAKIEVLTYMQAFRQFESACNTLVRNANSQGCILPDVYHTDEFLTQFSVISDVATYFSLATLCDDPSIVYEIARENIYIYNDPIELAVKDAGGKRIGYIPILKTWYADYTFDLIQTGNDFILQCTGCTSKSIDEQNWDDRSNILQRYAIDDKDQFFALFMEATGIDPIEGKDNIYSPYELDDTWKTTVTFESASTKAYSSGIYSYSTTTSSYLSNNNAPDGSPSYSYSTTTYLTDAGGSFPLAASNVTVTMNFMERYPQWIIDKYGTSEYHRGIDYSVPIGTPVLAIREGTITYAGPSSGYGYYVEVTHSDGSRSRYGHGNGVFNVSVGDKVSAGTQIMESGNSGNSTGPHMHLEVIGSDGKLKDPNKYIYEKPY